MADRKHPILLHGCLTALNKKIYQPAKTVLKSDVVKKNITKPVKKLANESFIKEYITDPIANASSGKTASDVKWVAKEAKEGIKSLSKSLLPPGLKEEDVKGGRMYHSTSFEKGTRTRKQGASMRDWDEDTWEDDEDSYFKADTQSNQSSVIECRDARGQIHMSVVEDITDELRTPEEKDSDVVFRDSEKLDITDPEKVEVEEMDLESSIRFELRNLEVDRYVNDHDTENFNEARMSVPRVAQIDFEPRYECRQVEIRHGRWSNRERVFSRKLTEEEQKQKRQTSRGSYSEEENVQFVRNLMAQSIPSISSIASIASPLTLTLTPRGRSRGPRLDGEEARKEKYEQVHGKSHSDDESPSRSSEMYASAEEFLSSSELSTSDELSPMKQHDEVPKKEQKNDKSKTEKHEEVHGKGKGHQKDKSNSSRHEKFDKNKPKRDQSPEPPATMFGSAEDFLSKSEELFPRRDVSAALKHKLGIRGLKKVDCNTSENNKDCEG